MTSLIRYLKQLLTDPVKAIRYDRRVVAKKVSVERRSGGDRRLAHR